jgi:hypothetical protein
MKKRDRASGLFWLGFGVLFVIGAWQHGLLRKDIPGPGFLPFIYGIIMIGLSLMVLIPAFGSGKKENIGGDERGKFFPEKGSRQRLAYVMTALVAYGLFLHYLGFFLTTFVFMLSMLCLMKPRKWARIFLLSLSTAILAYLFFDALEVQLPLGILG